MNHFPGRSDILQILAVLGQTQKSKTIIEGYAPDDVIQE